MKFVVTALMLIALVAPSVGTASAQNADSQEALKPLPEVRLRNFKGKPVSAASLKGRVYIFDFWATWCGPCRMIAPILDQLASEYQGKVRVAKLDVDTNIKTATRFNVRSIPMLLFFKDGKVVDQIVGAQPRANIEAKLKQHAA